MISKGQITIVDLNDGKTVNLYLGANQPTTQIYDPNATSSHYTPDYSTTGNNLVIKPEMFVSGSTTSVTMKSVSWSINGSTAITAGGSNTTYGATVASTHPYAMTIKKNFTSVNQIRIECTAVYTDPDTLVDTTAKANISFTKVDNAGNACVAVMYAPGGNVISSTAGAVISSVKLHCDLWRGSSIDNTNVTYQWYKLVGDTYQAISDGTNYAGTTTNELTIQADGVDNFEIFKCTIKDTDSASLTYNKTFDASMVVNDITDPYTVQVASAVGTVLTKGAASTTLVAEIWQNGQKCSDALHSSATYTWTRYDKDGLNPTDVTPTSGSKNQITVNRDDITVRATYVCQVSI